MKKIIALSLAAALTLGGCSLKNTKAAEEMPADKPWNRIIMETDSGYYYGINSDIQNGYHALRYTEKSNGADIFLCAKPECSHTGEESCTATYKFLKTSNYILYEGSIYFVANTSTDEIQVFSLYRASLDGTSLDKIGDVRKVKHQTGEGDIEFNNKPSGFIIHKGFAYIPYSYGGYDYASYLEDGFAKMDIQSGESELLFSSNKFVDSARVKVAAGAGDYVYYEAESNNSGSSGCFRYNIKSGKTEKISGELGKLLDDRSGHYGLSHITGKSIYAAHYDKDIYEIIGFDPETFEPDGSKIDLGYNENFCPQTKYYDNKFFVFEPYEVKVYSENGELIGGKPWRNPPEKDDDLVSVYTEDISDGKVYIGYYNNMELKNLEFDESTKHGENDYLYMYCCPVDDVISGAGKWTKAYEIKNIFDYWDKSPYPDY